MLAGFKLNEYPMKYLFALSILLITSCNSKETSIDQSVQLYDYITDRVWLTENKAQYYFSSKDDKEYLWMVMEHREDGTYSPFVEAKGTPSNNMISVSTDPYQKGWYESDYFKIENNILIQQDTDDTFGQNLTTFTLEIGKDTTIGILDYNTLKVINKYGIRTWVSRTRSENN